MRQEYFPELDGPQSFTECGRRVLCKGGGTQTTVMKNDPPAYLEDYYKKSARNAYDLSRLPYEPYSGQRIAGLVPEQIEGLEATAARARAGSPVLNAASSNLEATLRGDYLSPDSNPALQATVDRALGDVQSRVNSQFSGNNFGGSAHQEWMQRNLAETALPMYAENYDRERTRQMQANLFAPQMAQADYSDLQALLGVGDFKQGLNQQNLDFMYEQWLREQQDPYNKQAWLAGLLGGMPGSQGTSTGPNPFQQNTAANAVAGAGLGLGIGAAMAPEAATGLAAIGGPWAIPLIAGGALLGGML